jgi:hypothetical protein
MPFIPSPTGRGLFGRNRSVSRLFYPHPNPLLEGEGKMPQGGLNGYFRTVS